MSYVLHIWEQPQGSNNPTSVAEADKILEELRQHKLGLSPKFARLAQELTKRFPCESTSDSADMSESELAWSDGPLDGKTESLVYSIGLNTSNLIAVRPFIIKTANAFGLSVMDEQAGEVYLYTGEILRAPGLTSSFAVNKDNGVPTRNELKRIILDRLTPTLAKFGYKKDQNSDSFICLFPNGWHEISFFIDDYWIGKCIFDLLTRTRFHAVTDLIAVISNDKRSPQDIKLDATVSLGHKWMDGNPSFLKGDNKEYVISSYSDIDGVMDHLISNMESRLFPLLKDCETIKGLDRLLNPVPVSSSVFFKSFGRGSEHIIAAYLAKSPHIGQLCNEFEAKIHEGGGSDFSKDSTMRCIQYVRNQLGYSQSTKQ